MYVEDDASVSAELELAAIHFLEGVNQCRLTVKIHCVLSFLSFYLVDSDQAPTFGLRCEIASLPAFQGLR